MEILRIVLLGKTGAGKSALGNTLLGEKKFKSTAAADSTTAAESVTIKCEKEEGKLPSGRTIRVVNTPGLNDTKGRDVRPEITKAIAALSPGPHAIIIVLQPGNATEEEKRVIKELRGFFGDDQFLAHTLIVMTRKADIVDENDEPIEIHDFIRRKAAADVKELYEQCGRRIVAVENKHSSPAVKQQYSQEIVDEVLKMGGCYSHAYFKLSIEKKIQEQDVARLQKEIERVVREQRRVQCPLL